MVDSKSRAPRFRVTRMDVVYDTGDGFWSGPVVDFSESGLFVETHHDLPVGTRVTIVPDVGTDERLPFDFAAEVVRVQEYDPHAYFNRTPGIAFRFADLSEEQLQKVRAFLESRGLPDS